MNLSYKDLTCKRGSVGQSNGLSIPLAARSVVSSIPSKTPTTQIPMDLNFIYLQTRVLNYC